MDRSTSLCTQHSGVRRCAEARGAGGAPVAPELVDPAEDGRAHVARQLLADGDGQLLVDLSLAPWLLRLVLKAKVRDDGMGPATDSRASDEIHRTDTNGKDNSQDVENNSKIYNDTVT